MDRGAIYTAPPFDVEMHPRLLCNEDGEELLSFTD